MDEEHAGEEEEEEEEEEEPPRRRKRRRYGSDEDRADGGREDPGSCSRDADGAQRKRRVQPGRGPKSPTLAEQFPALAKYGLQAQGSPSTPTPRPPVLDLRSPVRESALEHAIEELQHRPITRKNSREVTQLIQREAAGCLTRHRSHQLSPLLERQPPHIRHQLEKVVSAEVPLISSTELAILNSLPEPKRRKVKDFLDKEIRSKRRVMSS